jgi:uncharacterized protein (DUF1501 family)
MALNPLVIVGRLLTAAFAEPGESSDELLVVVFLRGAWDSLNVVFPLEGEDRAAYEAARPTLKIPASGDKSALKLDARFGLHPAAKALFELYRDKKLAFVLASGLPSDTRSHFDAQNYMELGTPDSKATSSGWLARHLDAARSAEGMDAVGVGVMPPISLLSDANAAAIANPGGFAIGGGRPVQADLRRSLRNLYGSGDWLGRQGLRVLDMIDLLENAPGKYDPVRGADYPRADIGNKLKTLAQLVKLPLGLRAAAVDMGGWDTHKYQGNGSEGYFANLLGQLSEGLSAFLTDLGDRSKRCTVVVMSEFGRRVKENANHGTDHGHGSLMMVLGGGVNGGLYGTWPGLSAEKLYDRADLAVTTDFRRVLSEVLIRRRRDARLSHVFPRYSGYAPLGVTQGADLRPT